MALDAYDTKILGMLGTNSRATASQIAKQIRVSKETVNYRIKRLIDKGTISYFYTVLNASRLGYQYYKTFLELKQSTKETEEAIIDYLLNEDCCSNIRLTEGKFEISFLAMHKDLDHFAQFFNRFTVRHGDLIQSKHIHTLVRSHKFPTPLSKHPERRISFSHNHTMHEHIDDIDYELLSLLAKNSRMRLVDMAQQLKSKPQIIKYHIKKLEDAGIIVCYSAAINLKHIGKNYTKINISAQNRAALDSMLEFFESKPQCLFAVELIGKYDLSVEFLISDDQEMREIIDEFRTLFAGDYQYYDTARIYKEYLTNWSPFNNVSSTHLPKSTE